jgi:hypothetical protein
MRRQDMADNKLSILWTNADPITSHHMVMMYATNAMLRGWWDEVTVIIWGATAKYVAEDHEIREKMEEAKKAGVKFSACIACARNLGVKERLEELGFEVISWGPPLTEILKNGERLLTI